LPLCFMLAEAFDRVSDVGRIFPSSCRAALL
jgi:hypothetical protein